MMETQNFPAIIKSLLGDPIKGASSASDWRYGRNSHLSVNPLRGVWHDKKANVGGGLLDLVVNLGHAANRAEAAKWLEAGGLVSADHARVFCGETLAQKAKRVEAEASNEAVRRAGAAKIWAESVPIFDTPAWVYLTEARCIPKAALHDVLTLRFNPRVSLHPYTPNGRYLFPALVAKVQDHAGGFVGVHVTYLATDGSSKADVPTPRKMVGAGFSGASVRLGRGSYAVVAEGLESALSTGAALGLSAVGALSAGGVKTFEPWEGVKSVAFAPDIDASGVGMAAAKSAAERLYGQGVKIAGFAIPPGGHCDFNDAARAGLLNKEGAQ